MNHRATLRTGFGRLPQKELRTAVFAENRGQNFGIDGMSRLVRGLIHRFNTPEVHSETGRSRDLQVQGFGKPSFQNGRGDTNRPQSHPARVNGDLFEMSIRPGDQSGI